MPRIADHPSRPSALARAWLDSPALRQLTARPTGDANLPRDPPRLLAWSALTLDTRHAPRRRARCCPPVRWPATTADTVSYLVSRVGPSERHTMLVITSAIDLPYQLFTIAPPLLAAGTSHVEIVGTPTAHDGDPVGLAQRIGKEIHRVGHPAAVTPAGSGPAPVARDFCLAGQGR